MREQGAIIPMLGMDYLDLEQLRRDTFGGKATTTFELGVREPSRSRGLSRKVATVIIEHTEDFSGDALITVKYFARATKALRLPARALRAFAFKTVIPEAVALLEDMSYE